MSGRLAAPAATRRGYCACHAEDSQRHQRRQRAPQPLLEALDTAPATRKAASGTSGDNARRRPFWRLWILRLPCGTRVSRQAPSGGSGYCACHEADSQRHQRRQRAPQPLLEALDTAPATRKTASGTSGDNARRSPFWTLWVLRLPRGQPAAPAATTRAAAPSGGSGYCACHAEGNGTSGDNARRSPFWRLWILRLPRGRQPAAPAATTRASSPFWRLWVLRLPRGQPAAPAATTRAAAPSGGSGYCACHEADSQRHQRRQRAPQPLLEALGYCACHAEDSQRHQRRQRAPQPLLEALDTAPATRQTASGTSGDNARRSPFWRHGYTAPATRKTASGDNARRSPFWRLWVLRLPRGRQPAAPAATTRAAAPSGGSGYCACHEADSQRHQRRQRAPQPLLEALETAPATAGVRCDKKGE